MKKPNEPNKPFGYHLMLDMTGCKKELMNDVDKLYWFLHNFPKKIGVKQLAPPYVFSLTDKDYPDKIGLTGSGVFAGIKTIGIQYIVESTIIVCHTTIPHSLVSADIYSCKKFNVDMAEKELRRIYKPKHLKKHFVTRFEGML